MREIILFTLLCFFREVAWFTGLPNAMIPKFESVLTTFDYVKPRLSRFGGSVFQRINFREDTYRAAASRVDFFGEC